MISLRQYKEQHKDAVDALYQQADMGEPSSYEGILLAFDSDAEDPEKPIGLVRVAVSDGVAYVNPIVVDEEARGLGIGRVLMEHVQELHPDVRLVSRGPAIPFYRALGFDECDWESVDTRFTDDCDSCDVRESCQPLPMRWTGATEA